MITLRGCGLRLRGAEILHGIDLEVRPGLVTAVIGPNGAGKSSLLRMASGEVAPTGGRASFAGKPMDNWPPLDLARRRAVVGQRVSLTVPMLAEAVVALGRQPWHGTAAMRADAGAVADAMEMTGVAALARRDYAGLSGGEQQRVQLARALAQLEPMASERALLLDEPTASLDMGHAAALLRLLRRLAADGRTGVMLVLHDLNEASYVADHVVLLQSGRQISAGAPAEVLRPALLEPVYGVRFTPSSEALLPDYTRPPPKRSRTLPPVA